jgi:hypothetical protein
MMIVFFIISIDWPLAPQDSTQPLGNNWGEFQQYGYTPYLHPGVDVMGITIEKPVYAVQDGVVKAWLTTSGEWHWRLAIADYETNDSVEAWLYAHIDADQYHLDVGDAVTAGELIGYLVEWPIIGFDHLHFARIKDAGAVWSHGDWAFIQNPLTIITPYDDTMKPMFENALGYDLFALCLNNTSVYLSQDSVYGSVDIIARIHDKTGLPLPDTVWERLIPYKIEYEIHGPLVFPTTLSFIFHGILDHQNNVHVIYKDDGVCDTRGDYGERDYYFIVTNTDGDSIVEASDADYAWVTTDYPDGDYWIVVTAYDAAGTMQRDSMMVTIKNTGISEYDDARAVATLRVSPNPSSGSFIIHSLHDARIFDVSGRLVAAGKSEYHDFAPGIYFVVAGDDDSRQSQKLVVIRR